MDSIISHNYRTIIYVWTEWCHGSRHHFAEDVVPYLQQKPDSIGFISIFYGKESELTSILSENNCSYPTFRIGSMSGLDKVRMYKLLNSSVKDYKKMGYVPVSLLCDNNGNILNYNEETKKYSHIIDCIESVGGVAASVIQDTIPTIVHE